MYYMILHVQMYKCIYIIFSDSVPSIERNENMSEMDTDMSTNPSNKGN